MDFPSPNPDDLFIGKRYDDISRVANQFRLCYRVVSETEHNVNKNIAYTLDLKPERLNFQVVDGVIKGVWRG